MHIIAHGCPGEQMRSGWSYMVCPWMLLGKQETTRFLSACFLLKGFFISLLYKGSVQGFCKGFSVVFGVGEGWDRVFVLTSRIGFWSIPYYN